MLAGTLLGLVGAACTLPTAIDPNSACVEDANGFSTLDADSDPGVPISLSISTKGEHEDAFKAIHPATAGTLADDTATDGRYVLACPQAAGKKTVQFTISRPAEWTAFGAEWVQLFPKDSWFNATNEYEPFSFNEFGAKIPLPEFRPTSNGLANDASNMPELHVFMEVSGEGDYEIKYGNPGLTSGSKWVAVEFKSTLLRVGAPWADCTGSVLDSASYEVGSIMPVLFGGPNLNSAVALRAGAPSYDDVIAELSSVSVPVKVILEIFNAGKTSYTDSANEVMCYKAGNACPEKHFVCNADYCEMDVWKALIAGFKSASPGMVTVLGSLDASTSFTAYDDLNMDGFYIVGEADIPSSTPSPTPYQAPPPPFTFQADGIGYCHSNGLNAETVTKEECQSFAASRGAAFGAANRNDWMPNCHIRVKNEGQHEVLWNDQGSGNFNPYWWNRRPIGPFNQVCKWPSSHGYTCQTGQGLGGGPYVAITQDNSLGDCADRCNAYVDCAAIDFTTDAQHDACRLYFATDNPRIGNGGHNNRQYCVKPQDAAIALPTTYALAGPNGYCNSNTHDEIQSGSRITGWINGESHSQARTNCDSRSECAGYHWNIQDSSYVLVSHVPDDCCTDESAKGDQCYRRSMLPAEVLEFDWECSDCPALNNWAGLEKLSGGLSGEFSWTGIPRLCGKNIWEANVQGEGDYVLCQQEFGENTMSFTSPPLQGFHVGRLYEVRWSASKYQDNPRQGRVEVYGDSDFSKAPLAFLDFEPDGQLQGRFQTTFTKYSLSFTPTTDIVYLKLGDKDTSNVQKNGLVFGKISFYSAPVAVSDLPDVAAPLLDEGLVTVSAIGAPLFDEAAVDDATVYVTLSSSDLGLWNPFSWYPNVPPSKWAAIVTEATDTTDIATLFDRGYGWVYLTSETGLETKSTITSDVLGAIEAVSTARRLQGRRLEASEPFWGCDDTLFECKPICMKRMGAVTSKVSDKLCAEAPMDQCACKCYHQAQWTCEGSLVRCKAKLGAGELKTVGDKVCEMRGAPKPNSTAELRVANECEPMTEMRGSAPTDECLAQWGTPEPDQRWYGVDWLQESFAAPLLVAALALYA
jgi:hypothetical protein